MRKKVAQWSIGKAEQQKTKFLKLNGTLTGCDLIGIYIGTTFNTIQPMNSKHEHLKDPCDLPLCILKRCLLTHT